MHKWIYIFIFVCLCFNISYAEQVLSDYNPPIQDINIAELEKKFSKTFESFGKNKLLNRYTFFIRPDKWTLMSNYNKVKLYEDCTNYHIAKEISSGNNAVKEVSQRQIKIRNSLDGKLLAEYNPNYGIILKHGKKEIKELAKNIVLLQDYSKHKPRNQFNAIKNYKNLVDSIIKDNTYSYKNLSISRHYDIAIDKYGSINEITLLYSDYIPCIDDYAIETIRTISPFPEFNKQIKTDTINIHISILVNINDIEEFIKQIIKNMNLQDIELSSLY